MYDPNEMEQEKENALSPCEQDAPVAEQLTEETSALDVTEEHTCAGSETTPEMATVEWHSVSYQAGDATPTKKKNKKARRIAVIAAIVACALLVCAIAGVGGAMLASKLLFSDGLFEVQIGGGLPGGDVSFGDGQQGSGSGTGGTGGTLQSETPYPADTAEYDYAAAYAALVKNDGTTLVGSTNGSAGNSEKSLIEVTAAVKDSVVEITTTTVSNRGQIYAGAGSGVIIHKDGLIVTNHHVIADSDQIVVRLTNGETYYATLRGSDEEGDIAILKIKPREESPLTVAKLGYSGALALGESVIAIGNPLGELGGTVTNGIISALGREINVDGNKMTLLQTNAAINSGNSGGGLFNMAGELIGIVNAKYSATGVEGLGFAIPIDTAYTDSFADLCNYGYIRGIPALNVTFAEKPVQQGFFVTGYKAVVYDAGGNAQLKKDDCVISLDGVSVYNISTSPVAAIKDIVRSHKVGDQLSMVVKRGNEEITLTVTLTEYVPK